MSTPGSNDEWMDSVRRAALRRTAISGPPVAASAALVQLFVYHLPVTAIVIATGGLAWGATYVLVRRGVATRVAFHYLASVGMLTLASTSFLRGGFELVLCQFFLVFPVGALMLRLRGAAITWGAVALVAPFLLVLTEQLGWAPARIPVPSFVAATATTALMVVLSGLAWGAVTMFEETATLAARDEREAGRRRRLESLGRLAGGVAHDFNNLLAIVRSSAESLETAVETPDEIESRKAILDAAAQGAYLTGSLLAFTRDDETASSVSEASIVVERTAALARRVLPATIEVEVHTEEGLRAHVRADALSRALLNLCLNARDAMPEGGRLELGCEALEIESSAEAPATVHGDLAPGRWLCVRVADDGHGIDEEQIEHIFEPFFTTKHKERGTGLGLAGVVGTLLEARGAIGVRSDVGQGSEFRLYLRRAKDVQATEKIPTGPHRALPSLRVLLVEDDEQVRRATSRVLRGAAIDITEVDSGAAALEEVEGSEEPFDVLLTDFEMPSMSGIELVKILKKRGFEGRIIVMTGYAEADLDAEGAVVLRKPCGRDDLLDAIGAA